AVEQFALAAQDPWGEIVGHPRPQGRIFHVRFERTIAAGIDVAAGVESDDLVQRMQYRLDKLGPLQVHAGHQAQACQGGWAGWAGRGHGWPNIRRNGELTIPGATTDRAVLPGRGPCRHRAGRSITHVTATDEAGACPKPDRPP